MQELDRIVTHSRRITTLNQIYSEYRDLKSARESLKSLRGSRHFSVVLTRFSVREWELAAAISELIDLLTIFPNSNLSHMLESKAATLVNAVRSLVECCVDTVRNFYDIPAPSVDVMRIEEVVLGIKAKLHTSVALTADTLKESVVSDLCYVQDMKQKVFVSLIEVAQLANELLEYVVEKEKVMREQASKGHETNIRPATIYDPEKDVQPDGEGFGLYISSGQSRPQNCHCIVCSTDISAEDSIISYIGKLYHENCFRCVACGGQADPGSFLTLMDKPLCIQCSPLCDTCQEPVTFDCFLALEKVYHKSCFTCDQCSQIISPGEKFYRLDNRPCCIACMSDPSDKTVFKQSWSPKMATRYSMFLLDEGYKPLIHWVDDSLGSRPSWSPPQSLSPDFDNSLDWIHFEASISAPVPPPRNLNRVRKDGEEAGYPTSPPLPPPRKISINDPQTQHRPDYITISDYAPTNADVNKSDPIGLGIETPPTSAPNNKGGIMKRIFATGSDNGYLQRTEVKENTLAALETLPVVLGSEDGRAALVKFCTEDLSIAKLYFWMDVEQFRLISVTNVPKMAETVYKRYVLENYSNDYGLHLPSSILTNITQTISTKTYHLNMFDEAQRAVYDWMEADLLPRFLSSTTGKHYLAIASSNLGRKVSNTEIRPFRGTLPPAKYGKKKPDGLASIEIVGHEKRYQPDREYIYEILLRRYRDVVENPENSTMPEATSKFCPVIYRSYQEIQELHVALNRFFPVFKGKFPPFPSKQAPLFQRSRKAKGRVKELNEYFDKIFRMPAKVAQSIIMKKFVEPSTEDLANFEFNRRLGF